MIRAWKAFRAWNERGWERARARGRLYFFFRHILLGLMWGVCMVSASMLLAYYYFGSLMPEEFWRLVVIHFCGGMAVSILLWTLNEPLRAGSAEQNHSRQ